jgi:hypothetical protein
VFFGASSSSVSHVGIYAGIRGGQAVMAGAPHAGADVRVEPFPATPGAPWGTGTYLGATRPATAQETRLPQSYAWLSLAGR